MRADEFLVEKYMTLEKKCAELELQIEDLEEENEKITEELADYDNLVNILAKYLVVKSYGIEFCLKDYKEQDYADIEYLKNYFEIKEKEDVENG